MMSQTISPPVQTSTKLSSVDILLSGNKDLWAEPKSAVQGGRGFVAPTTKGIDNKTYTLNPTVQLYPSLFSLIRNKVVAAA